MSEDSVESLEIDDEVRANFSENKISELFIFLEMFSEVDSSVLYHSTVNTCIIVSPQPNEMEADTDCSTEMGAASNEDIAVDADDFAFGLGISCVICRCVISFHASIFCSGKL